MSAEVIKLAVAVNERIYPRQLFECAKCGHRMFKLHKSDGELYVECANCEQMIDFEDLE